MEGVEDGVGGEFWGGGGEVKARTQGEEKI